MWALALGFLRGIPLREWLLLGLAVALFSYHEFDKHAAVSEARAEVGAQWEKRLNDANAQAAADAADKQAQIDKLAASSNPAIKAKVDSIAAQINALTVKVKAPPKVFPDNCVMPASEVAGYNAIH